MSYFDDIQNKRNEIRNNIAKGFGCEFIKAQDDELEKAVYADTPQNRKLGRVGQEYHRGKAVNEIPKRSVNKGERKGSTKCKIKFDKEDGKIAGNITYDKYNSPRYNTHRFNKVFQQKGH